MGMEGPCSAAKVPVVWPFLALTAALNPHRAPAPTSANLYLALYLPLSLCLSVSLALSFSLSVSLDAGLYTMNALLRCSDTCCLKSSTTPKP